jgi:hypothetical protein
MSYLPPDPLISATWPKAYGKDIVNVLRQIESKWLRHFPELDYYGLKKATTPMTDPDQPTGEPGNTQFDPVWGESVPESMAVTGWKQPHGDGVADAADTELFRDPVKLNFRVQREAHELELKKYGFDKIRDLLLFIPLTLLDKAGVTMQQGDYVSWDGDEYTFLQIDRVGYWKNTNVRLYMAINCEHRRHGA